MDTSSNCSQQHFGPTAADTHTLVYPSKLIDMKDERGSVVNTSVIPIIKGQGHVRYEDAESCMVHDACQLPTHLPYI